MLRWAFETAALVAVVAASCTSGAAVRPQPAAPGPPPIPDGQPAVNAPLFIGQNVFAHSQARQAGDSPALSTARSDGANTGVTGGAAPLGKSPGAGSDQTALLPPVIWDRRGGLTAGCQIELTPGTVRTCVAAVDPATLAITARWSPPGQDLTAADAVVDDQMRVLVATRQGHVIVLQSPETGGAIFHLLRDVDVSASLGPGEQLLAVRPDDDGNIWFTTGGTVAAGAPAVTTTTVGYLTPAGQVAATHLVDQLVESVFAVGHDNVFVATSPAGAADHAAATGFVYNLVAAGGAVQTRWRESYDAGSGRKPGGLTRGSGSPVVLLGERYLALADNADGQVHLDVFAQGTPPTAPAPRPDPADPRLVCRVPLFSPGASAVNAAPIGYATGGAASVIVANGFNAPPVVNQPDINGAANNVNQMAPGLSRIDVAADGSGCSVAWSEPVRFKAPPVLSTATGLVYGYSQDEQRATAGNYVWYFVAVDFATGRVAWRQRAGAGGTKNDNLYPASLGPDGTLYQTVPNGLVWMRDVGLQP